MIELRSSSKFRGVEADINDDIEDYEDDLKQVSTDLSSSILALRKLSFFR